MIACHKGHSSIARLLLDSGASTGEVRLGRGTALICAATNGHTDCVRMLIAEGSNADLEVTFESLTALQWAERAPTAGEGHRTCVRLLLQALAVENGREESAAVASAPAAAVATAAPAAASSHEPDPVAQQRSADQDAMAALDDQSYHFELSEQTDTYEELRLKDPPDKRTLPLALLERAKAGIPMIEQLERDHPRMARLFQKGLLPSTVWEQLLEAEAIMDVEVHAIQAEAERLQVGWGQGVFSQAYQMLRKDREDEQRAEQVAKDAAVLTLTFTEPSGKGACPPRSASVAASASHHL